ncbi:hypothetical protein ACFL4C_01485 [Candidatus Omnitrophota bacterium]
MINVRLDGFLRLIAVILFLTFGVAIPGYAQDVFGYKLDAGIGSTKSVLENQGYVVNIKKDLTYIRLSSIEIFDFKNEYLNNMQLWINSYKGRVYVYKWAGVIMADLSGVASIERLLQYISRISGEQEIPVGMKSTYKKIDVSLLKAIATSEGSEDLDFVWKNNKEQIEMFLSSPLLPISDMEADFTLRYFLPEVENKVLAYQYGD